MLKDWKYDAMQYRDIDRAAQARAEAELDAAAKFTPIYAHWRHGGWYVVNVRYPSGAVGCVSRNYADRKWRIVCHPLPFDQQPTFRSRDEAARAEYLLARAANQPEVK